MSYLLLACLLYLVRYFFMFVSVFIYFVRYFFIKSLFAVFLP